MGATGLAFETWVSMISSVVYNANNQLVQWGSTAMTYDANGNTLNDGSNSYVWDARNRLVSADNNAASFSYDPLGRRMGKTFMSANTNYIYDGANPVQELNGTTPTANLLTGGVDERFTRTEATGTYNFLTDALGSTVALTDSTGNSQTQYSYDPYGVQSASGAYSTNSFTYTGRETDGLGIDYYRARYYNPTTGRFLSEDPIGLAGGINEYAYVGDDPTDWIDPFGLDKKDPWNPCSTKAVLSGLFDFGLGSAKIASGLFFAPETGFLSLYGVYSGVSNLGSAGAELYGGISGNLAAGKTWSNRASAAGAISGIVTWGISGNAQYGANASTIEGLATVGITGGLTSTGTMKAASALDNSISAVDNGVGAVGLAGLGECHE
jgi:RHS repeat-associated protein